MIDHKEKPIHEVLDETRGMLIMQTMGVDIAVPYWKGAPGIAKTALANHMCKKSNMILFETHYGQKPVEEVSGLPIFKDVVVNGITHKGTEWTIPDVLTELVALSNEFDGDGNRKVVVWLLDDFHLAPPAMMALGFELFTERRLRGAKIPDNVAFLLAGNISAKAGSKKNLLSAVVNRVAIIPVKLDFTFWKTNYAIPNGVNNKVLSFLSHEKYQKYFQMEEQLDKPWSSARSWTKFANFLTPLEQFKKGSANGLQIHDILYWASAHVGEESASEFTTYYKIFGEVETEKIFNGEIAISVPSDRSGQYIFALATTTEFFDRYKSKDSSIKNDSVAVMANIIIALLDRASEMAIVALKEIVLTGNILKLKNVYSAIKQNIAVRKPDAIETIEKNIKDL